MISSDEEAHDRKSDEERLSRVEKLGGWKSFYVKRDTAERLLWHHYSSSQKVLEYDSTFLGNNNTVLLLDLGFVNRGKIREYQSEFCGLL